MTPEEVIDLLTLIAARDNRTVGRTTAMVWHEDIGDLAFADCREAVARHFRESTDWLMPAHIRRTVKDIRSDRLSNSDLALPAADPADEEAYRKALANIRRQVGDGRMPFRAIEGGKPAEPSAKYKAARSAEDNDRVLAQTVACPVEWCPARPGEPCRPAPEADPIGKWHPSRLKAARLAQGVSA